MPAVALTDHGSLAGAVELYQEAGKVGVKPILGCELYVAEDRHAQKKGYAHLTLLAEDNAGYANLIKLASAGYLEGYYYKPRVDWELLERHSQGLIALSGCLSGRVCKALEENRADDAAHRPRPARADLRARLDLRRDAERGPRDPVADQPRPGEARGRGGPAARRDRRRALPPARRRARARGAALHPVGRLAQEPEPLEVRHRSVLLQVAGGDGARLSGPRGGDAAHAGDRRALQRRARARQDPAAEVPGPGRQGRLRVPRRALRKRPGKALRTGNAGADRAPALRAQDDQGDGLRRLLPDRLGLHRLRQAKRDRGGPGARLGGGLARGVLPRHHRRRPDPLRAAVRALPQPGPQVHARHGHRLRGRRPRSGHQLRRREVRARPRRPDHHLRDDDGPRRGARRRARARGPLRRRRQGREADPRRAEGLPRRVPQARRRAEAGLRLRPAGEGDRRPRQAARRARPPGLDPRRRCRDLGPPAHRRRAAAAEGRRPGGRDPVQDGRRRDARPAEDGLPRPAQPRRDRQGARAGRRGGHHQAPARRRGHLQDAAEGRRGRRLPVRVVGNARGAAPGQADRVRGPDRARGALPPGPDGLHPRLRAPQGRAGGGLATPTRAWSRSPG